MIRFEKMWAIARKEFSEFRRNRYVLMTLVMMPLIMTIVLPVAYLVPVTALSTENSKPVQLTFDIQNTYEGMNFSNAYFTNASFKNCELTNVILDGCQVSGGYLNYSLVRSSQVNDSWMQATTVYFSNLNNDTRIDVVLVSSVVIGGQSDTVGTLLLLISVLMLMFMVIPAVLPTIIASYTLVGEKVNKSLEPLLATPTTDLELLGGKSLSIFIPTMLAAWLSFIPFVILVDVITKPVLGYFILPNLLWIMAVFVMSPLIAILSILANVIVSSRVSDVRSAQQLGSLVVLPVILFFIIILTQSATTSVMLMGLFSVLLVGIDALMLYLALQVFRREEILIRWK
ncbi:MAG: ABC transporter permease subunit [Methanomassiliicoccales archaeon]|jgi:ABC-2 type transport system permease protein